MPAPAPTALPDTDDLLLSVTEAAIYCEMTPLRFMTLVDQHRMPASISTLWGRRRLWRVRDLDKCSRYFGT